MPIIKSSIKRVKVAEKRQKRNIITKKKYKELIKKFIKLIGEDKIKEAQDLLPRVQKTVDMATKKNLLHKNNAARKKSQLAKMVLDPKEKKPTEKTAEVKK